MKDAGSEGLSADRACAALVQLDTLLKRAVDQLSAEFSAVHHALTQQQTMATEPACAALAAQACRHLDHALTALQFEDIASQLIASVQREWLIVRAAPADASCPRISQPGISHPGVTQHHMESGEIELF